MRVWEMCSRAWDMVFCRATGVKGPKGDKGDAEVLPGPTGQQSVARMHLYTLAYPPFLLPPPFLAIRVEFQLGA